LLTFFDFDFSRHERFFYCAAAAIRNLDASLVTQAGTFTRCAVIRNEQPLKKGTRFVTEWTYAPKVGLAQISTSTIDAKGRQQEQTKLQLVAYHVQ